MHDQFTHHKHTINDVRMKAGARQTELEKYVLDSDKSFAKGIIGKCLRNCNPGLLWSFLGFIDNAFVSKPSSCESFDIFFTKSSAFVFFAAFPYLDEMKKFSSGCCYLQRYILLMTHIELICCNGPVWLYPVYLFWVDMSCWMYWAVGVCCWPGCWRCTCPAGYILYSINLCFHMWWCMHVVDEWVVSMGLSSSARWVALTWSDGLGWCIEFWTSLGRKWAPPLHPFVMSNY